MSEKQRNWESIAVLTTFNHTFEGLPLPFDLGNGVQLEATPASLKDKKLYEHIDPFRRELIEESKWSLIIRYPASSFGDPDLDWKGDKPRGKQDVAQEKIIFAQIALWLTKPAGMGSGFQIDIQQEDDGSWIWRNFGYTEPCLPTKTDQENQFSAADLTRAAQLNLRVAALPRSGPAWTAATIYLRGLREIPWDLRFTLMWIAMEALFGPDDARETSFRLCQRITLFLESRGEKAKILFRELLKSYGSRSKAVHGMRFKGIDQDKAEAQMVGIETCLRRSLTKILESKITAIISETGREDYLDNLALMP
jgi:hypothetical protein